MEYYFLGVGGIEAEAVMLGQAISMVLPNVVGYKLTGHVNPFITSTDVVLTITKVERQFCISDTCIFQIKIKEALHIKWEKLSHC